MSQKQHSKFIVFLVLMNYYMIVQSVNESVIINSTALTSGHMVACPNETINFRCTVMNTTVLKWKSNEYIGRNHSLIFIVGNDRPGDGKKVDQKPTFARLVAVKCSSQNQRLCNITSDLQITVLSESDVYIRCESDISSKLIGIAHSAIPERPRLLTPTLVGQSQRILIYQIQWKLPNNFNDFDFEHYQVEYGEGSSFESTTVLKESVLVSFEDNSVSNISVSTVNRCGQQSEYDIIAIPSGTVVNSLNSQQQMNTGTVTALSICFVIAIFVIVILIVVALVFIYYKANILWGRKPLATIDEFQHLEEVEPLLKFNHDEEGDHRDDPDIHQEAHESEDTNDLNPNKMAICDMISNIFKRHGAVALKTPFLELEGTTKKRYNSEGKRLYHLTTSHGQFYSLRYDLTVPFARYIARNRIHKMKRYQIDSVYRRDKSKKIIGTNWEFYQCDFDIAGKCDPMIPDAECLKIVIEVLSELRFDMKKVFIKVTYRDIISGIFVNECKCSPQTAEDICGEVENDPDHNWIDVCSKRLPKNKVETLTRYMRGYINLKGLRESGLNFDEQGLEDMEKLQEYCEAQGISDRVRFDPTLPFRLGYYTGVIFEAVIVDYEGKSVVLAAGGRYDNMVAAITPDHQVPCVGFTINIEEIFKIFSEREHLNLACVRQKQTDILVASGQGCLSERLELCTRLWESKIKAEFFYKQDPKLDEQIDYCKEYDIPYCVIVKQEGIQIMDMRNEVEELSVNIEDAIIKLKQKIKERENSTYTLFKTSF